MNKAQEQMNSLACISSTKQSDKVEECSRSKKTKQISKTKKNQLKCVGKKLFLKKNVVGEVCSKNRNSKTCKINNLDSSLVLQKIDKQEQGSRCSTEDNTEFEFSHPMTSPRNNADVTQQLTLEQLDGDEQKILSDDAFPLNNLMDLQAAIYRIDFLPNLPTSQQIIQGVPVSFKEHLKDILKHYDVISVPKSFLDGVMLPEEGRFFTVNPENPDQWWQNKTESFRDVKDFINHHQ